MTRQEQNASREWSEAIVQDYRRAWRGQLQRESFAKIFADSFVFHSQDTDVAGPQAYHDFIQTTRKNIPNLDLVPEIVFSDEERVLLYFRWTADQWHPDIVEAGQYSNFGKVVLRIEQGKIAEKWQQLQDFIFLVGKDVSTKQFDYPDVLEKKVFIRENGVTTATDDATSMAMSDLAKKVIDCAFGHSSMINLGSLLSEDLIFYNGQEKGHGIAGWKSFAYAIRTAFVGSGPVRFDEVVVREKSTLTVFLRIGIAEHSRFVLPNSHGMIGVLKLGVKDSKIHRIQTYPENYIFFLGTDFSKHGARVKRLFQGDRFPLEDSGNDVTMETSSTADSGDNSEGEEQVAVVGIAGRFPQASSVGEFWKNLVQKKNVFTEFPDDRPGLGSGTNVRYASFVSNAFQFDAEYFQIPPIAAEYMDPQQRLLLEVIVQSIDDSGHSNEDFSGDRTAVFVTTLSSDYEKLLRSNDVRQNFYYWAGNEQSMFVGKIARFLNIQGATRFVNAECTGSIAAIHEACELIKKRQVDQAIVGATSLFLHSYGFAVREEGILTHERSPKIFSCDSQGQLRGEAVVSVVLKSLSKALEDGDDIYATIPGSAANNSGKTFSLIAANVEMQAKVISDAWSNASMDLADISVVECNASGVREGDYSEVAAMKKVFGQRENVYLSTVKGAIGHCEAASGLVSLVKVILQLRHKKILGIQELEKLDPDLGLDGTGLIPLPQDIDWVSKTNIGNEQPLVAGINSFAGGGYNTHLVVKEYVLHRNASSLPDEATSATQWLVVLSAQTKDGLVRHSSDLKAFLLENESIDLTSVAFTLQSREARDFRAAFIVSNRSELFRGLDLLKNDNGEQGEVFWGEVGAEKSSGEPIDDSRIAELCSKNDLVKLADIWCKGGKVPWDMLATNKPLRRIAGIPARGFSGDHYRPPIQNNPQEVADPKGSFRFSFSGSEYFIADHRVDGKHVLPGVVHLEMARFAAVASVDRTSEGKQVDSGCEGESGLAVHIRNTGWASPVVFELAKNPLVVNVEAIPHVVQGNRRTLKYEIYSNPETGDGERILYSKGDVSFERSGSVPVLDLPSLKEQCNDRIIEANQCYQILELMGIEVGIGYRAIGQVFTGLCANGSPQALAKLHFASSDSRRESFAGEAERFVLGPAIMDAALQAGFLGLISEADLGTLADIPVPFALGELKIFNPCNPSMWAWIRHSKNSSPNDSIQKIDIDLCDDRGRVFVSFNEFSTRSPQQTADQHAPDASSEQYCSEALPTMFEGQQDGFESELLLQRTVDYLKNFVGKEFKISPNRIRAREPLDKYGIDSAMVVHLTGQLEHDFGSLPKTIFYDYRTIEELANFFVASYKDAVKKLLGLEDHLLGTQVGETETLRETKRASTEDLVLPDSSSGQEESKLGIAIVGISGRYPMSENLDKLWENLRDGVNCISVVPRERWDWSRYYGQTNGAEKDAFAGSHLSKWGGFLEGVDKFDAPFFGISMREAATMDPQERILLEEVWRAIEDAGYTRKSIQKTHRAGKTSYSEPVGVYVGAMYNEYQLFGAEESLRGNLAGLGGSSASIANRVSHFMDFQGPSMAIDTMCSASLTSLHLACQDLKQRRTSVGIVGGVNLTIHPNKYLILSERKMISTSSRVGSFGSGSDGYIPGEGVGVAVLKRLEDAERDNDHIYGVIQGSAINHNGRTNGFSTPNPRAQQNAVEVAMSEAGLVAEDVSYIEAHGTGTKLGDPIEISALTRAFRKTSDKNGFCLIGSIKSNLGHCEAASGLGGLIKVLLQMKYKKVVASLHATPMNPNIDFKQTPFVVNQELSDWVQPVRDGRKVPRTAGISCFGAGGSNAHLVVQEYIRGKKNPMPLPKVELGEAYIVPLSAKTQDALQSVVKNLLAFLHEHMLPTKTIGNRAYQSGSDAGKPISMARLAYTLQVGREAMDERLGFIVSSLEELKEKLDGFLNDRNKIRDLYRGSIDQNRDHTHENYENPVWQRKINAWIADMQFPEVLKVWVRGADVDWNQLYRSSQPQKVGLPTYPFSQARCWFDEVEGEVVHNNIVKEKRRTDFAFLSNKQMSFDEKAEKLVVHALTNVSGVEIPYIDVELRDLHLESIHVVGFMDFWQAVFGKSIDAVVFYQSRTVRDLKDDLISHALLTEEDLTLAEGILAKGNKARQNIPFRLTDLQESFVVGRNLKTYGQSIGSTIYFELDIQQVLEVNTLESVWNQLVRYHDSLHTVINADFSQKVLADIPRYSIRKIDCSSFSQAQVEGLHSEIRREMNCMVFDLQRWPYFEVCVSILSSEHMVLHVAVDEVIADGCSIFILIDQLYQMCSRVHYQLPASDYSLRHHIAFLDRVEKTDNFDHSLQYWKNKLKQLPPGPDIPYRTLSHDAQQKVHCFEGKLEDSLWFGLKEKAKSLGCSPGTILLTVFCSVLHHHTEQRTFSLNLTNLNRLATNQDVLRLVGLLANSNIFISRFQPEMSFEDWVLWCQKQLDLDASHSFVGAVRVLREMRKENSTKFSAPLPVVFTNMIQSIFQFPPEASGWKLREMMNTTPQVYLDHQVFDVNGTLHYRWYVADALVQSGEINSIFEAYQRELRDRACRINYWNEPTKTQFDGDKNYSLTGLQRALAVGRFLPASMGGKGCVFHMEFDFERLDLSRLSEAWNQVVQHHPILRTTLLSSEEQKVLDSVPYYSIENKGVSTTVVEFEEKCMEIRKDMLRNVYTLDSYPYYAIRAFGLMGGKSRVFINIDFIIADGRSIARIISQWFQKYEHTFFQLPSQVYTFQDYVRSRERMRNSLEYRDALRYWNKKFSSLGSGPRSFVEQVSFPSEVDQLTRCFPWWKKISAMSSTLHVSPESILLAVYGEVIFKWNKIANGKPEPINIAVVCWDQDADVPAETTGVFTRLSWVSFADNDLNPETKIKRVQQQLDEDKRHAIADGLEVLQGFRGLSFPVVFTTVLNMVDAASCVEGKREMVYSISHTPHVVLDNITSVIDESNIKIQWDTAIPNDDRQREMFDLYCTTLENWIQENDQSDKGLFNKKVEQIASEMSTAGYSSEKKKHAFLNNSESDVDEALVSLVEGLV